MRSAFIFIPVQVVQSLLLLCLILQSAQCGARLDKKERLVPHLTKAGSGTLSASRSSSRTARDVQPDTAQDLSVEYTLVTANSPDCESSLVDNFPVRVQYRRIESTSTTSAGSVWTDSPYAPTRKSGSVDCENNFTPNSGGNESVQVTVRSYSLSFPSTVNQVNNGQTIQLRLIQSDHRGGFCDCWAVTNVSISFLPASSNSENEMPLKETCARSETPFTTLSAFLQYFQVNGMINNCTGQTIPADSEILGFCRGSASVPRGFVSVEVGASNTTSHCSSEAAVVDSGKSGPMVGDQCDDLPHVEVRFTLKLGGPGGNSLNSFDEGLEFSFQALNGSRDWIPLMFYSSLNTKRDHLITVGNLFPDEDIVNIRGYNVNYTMLANGGSYEVEVKICGEEVMQGNSLFGWMKFRWLQSVTQINDSNRDRVLLDNIQISINSTQQQIIFSDSFENQTSINNNKWKNAERVSLLCDGQCQLQFGMAAPTFRTSNGYINSRGISTTALNPNRIQVSYTLITANSRDCLNFRSFTAQSPRLQYRFNENLPWITIKSGIETIPCKEVFKTDVCEVINYPVRESIQIQFRFVQLEHSGGFCDCWGVANFTVTFPEGGKSQLSEKRCMNSGIQFGFVDNFLHILDITDDEFTVGALSDTPFVGFCEGSASVPRGFVSNYFTKESDSDSRCFEDVNEVVFESKGMPPTNCSESSPRLELTFDLDMTPDGCNMPNRFDDGVELSFRLSNGNDREEWIPIIFYVHTLKLARPASNRSITDEVDLTNSSSITIRGYTVPFVNLNQTNDRILGEVQVCGEEFFNRAVEFRWLQTIQQQIDIDNPRWADIFSLDNVTITSMYSDRYSCELFMDNFDDQTTIDYGVWNKDLSYNVQLQNGSISQCAKYQRAALFFSANSSDYINSRQIVTLPLEHKNSFTSVQVHYTMIIMDSQDCLNSATFTAESPQLQYRHRNGEWTTVNPSTASTVHSMSNRETATTFVAELNSITEYIQFRFVQLEHRGGLCDCWEVANLTVESGVCKTFVNEVCEVTGQYTASNRTTIIDGQGDMSESFTVLAGFCGGSASIPRGFVTHKIHPKPNMRDVQSCDENSVVVNRRISPSTNCSSSELRIEVTFDLEFLLCGSSVESFHEGVEFSFKSSAGNSTGEWIPLMYFARTSDLNEANERPSPISIVENVSNTTNNGFFILRGYRVPYVISNRRKHSISLCRDESVLKHPLQLRWLQTASQSTSTILLDNITVSLQQGILSASLFEDPTSSQNFDILKRDNVDLLFNARPVSSCRRPIGNGGALLFYLKPGVAGNSPSTIISSRELVIGPLDPENVTLQSSFENKVRSGINNDPRLSEIWLLIEELPEVALETLAAVLAPIPNPMDSNSEVNLVSATYLLSSISNVFADTPVPPRVSEMFLSVANSLLDASQRNVERGTSLSTTEDSAGSTLLQVLDRFALRNHDASHPISSNNIVFHVQEVEVSESIEQISPIERESAQIMVPREVFGGLRRGEPVRMASFLFRNMSGLLPERLNNSAANNSDDQVLRLASPVISASFQCENCTTSNLSTPVQVTFKHLPYDMDLLENDQNGSEIMCVFWDFNDDIQRPGAVLFQGEWSEEGCYVNQNMSTFAETVCECTHLTNFAILLSARPPDFTRAQTLTLQAVGYIGVSVSLIAMATTVFVFLSLKPLRTMRNYIHIQLCITLGIAQIIFVAGIQPNLGEGHLVGGVPVGCRLVAVLLHYWFLVSFMWMLMEGVVLYVALVRVFIKYHARYIVAFTIASYGIPLIYVGGLTVPLGFARSEDIRKNQYYDYGYEQACYLSPARSFIWSFIAPVILIILTNFGFFIMAIAIMYRHQKKQQSRDKAERVRHWLKASISLTVVMGLTWIIGVLVIEVEELFALAFIFTIFVAFQGLFIFVIFVPLSKQVRENYAKWWKAKVAESDFLSKHFGDKSFTTSLTSQHLRSCNKSLITLGSSVAAVEEKEDKTRSEVIKNSYVQEGPLLDEKPLEAEEYGNFFTVTFIPNSSLTITNPTTDNADSAAEKGLYTGLSGDNTEEIELNEKRAVPNHYVDHRELLDSAFSPW